MNESFSGEFPVAVVGGGIAGFTAALTLKSLNIDHIWLGAKMFGDKLSAAEYVRNFPSFVGDGKSLCALLSAQAEHEEICFTRARIDGIYAGDPFTLMQNGESVTAQAVILATGVELVGSIRGEKEFLGRGVSYCAVCDGALYRGKDVAAVLDGEKFAHEAEYLARFARKVYVFCRRGEPQFEADNIQLVSGAPKEILGERRVRAVVYSGGELPVDGVFFLKDSLPPSALVGGLQAEDGRVVVDRTMATNLSGLFAAGDVTGTPYQYAKAAGEGLIAAYSAASYLKSKKQLIKNQ